ncbi:MAG: type II/IV secretion system ATPase subunit [Candidatus Altiarchaeota archaeon]|nr:type II/IV secretion system ATPase subunit [Candidatus Altiarchaeota archaeon]
MDAVKKIKVVDCSDCPRIATAQLSDKCKVCIGKDKYKLVLLESNLITKEYDGETMRLIQVVPFFVDCRFYNPVLSTEPLASYEIYNGAKVDIRENVQGVGYVYNISIPEMEMSFKDIKNMQYEVEKMRALGKTDNELLNRWYGGHGILDYLLRDEKILEININPPPIESPMRLLHEDFDECLTNVYPTMEFLNYLATTLKINTGRPLNKAQPQLDGEIMVGTTNSRVCAVVDPFSVFGPGYSIRKHREQPWTSLVFMKKKAFNPWFCGLMSFVIAHGRSFLVAGPRGSGKTSILGALILEILPKYRIITIEDTQELPVRAYNQLGYDILPLKVRSALLKSGMEMPFDIGLRTSLRLGDSVLIVGEIRSKEATVLYEAMRVGAMSNVVAGTVHSDSPYGVFDRVVNDLGVPRGSFKVTDLIIIVNQIKTPTGLTRMRRVLSVTEVLKHWEDEPVFQDLLVYNPKTDQLEPTEELLKGKSETINQILSRTSGFHDYEGVLNDILLRGWAKKAQLELAKKPEQLEAATMLQMNMTYAKLFEAIKPLDSDKNKKEFEIQYISKLKDLLKGS